MPPIKALKVSNSKVKLESYKLPDPEKKGIMCTECKKVYWGAVSVEKCRCGDTDPDHRFNVSSADFNKYSGRFIREDALRSKR